MKYLAMTGEIGKPIATLRVCLQNWPLKLIKEEVRMWQKSLSVTSSKCQLRRSTASQKGALVKSQTTSKLMRMS
jgi:hypothetical protein